MTKPVLINDNEKATRTKTQTTMPETNIALIEKRGLLLEIETPQTVALQKENVVELELQRIEKAYSGLRVNGLDDEQGIKLVSDARKYCKKMRTTTENVCKAGRAPAIDEQYRWLQIEKYVVDRVRKVENELIAEERRIEELREVARKEAARLLKEEEERLDSICLEFAGLGKPHPKEEIRHMERGIVEALLTAAHKEKADKEEAERLEKERLAVEKDAADREVRRLQEEGAAAEAKAKAEADALRDKIAALETEAKRKEIPAPAPEPETPVFFAPAPATATATADREADLISQDKAALLDFAQKLLILKKYLPVVRSKKALDFNNVIAEQVDKFAAFVAKKAEVL